MSSWLALWWVWVCLALAFGVVEVLLPTWVFLGFALGALAMALVVVLFPSLSTAALLALFALLSLLGWIFLRQVFRRQSSGARIVTRDINED